MKCNQDFAKREELEPKVVVFFAEKLSNLDAVLNKLMQLKRITDGGLGGQSLQSLVNFGDFATKIAILMAFQSHFARFWSNMNNYSKLLKFRSH